MLAAEAAGPFAGVAPKASGLDAAMVRKIPARKNAQEENQRREREKRLSALQMHLLADDRGSVFKVFTSGEVEDAVRPTLHAGQRHYKRKLVQITSATRGCPELHIGRARPSCEIGTDV
jgi:hypothetical protein